MPRARAMRAMSRTGNSWPVRFVMWQIWMIFVFGVIALAKFSGSSESTKCVVMPIFLSVTSSCVSVPPYSVRAATISSPCSATLSSATNCAAMPVAAATAARPPSSAATRSSSTATVGLDSRE